MNGDGTDDIVWQKPMGKFTFYWGRSRNARVIPKVKTSGKRFRSKLKRVNEWGKKVRNKYPQAIIWKIFSQKLDGHIRYYGVSHNIKAVINFRDKARMILFKQLNRLSQRKHPNTVKINCYCQEIV